MKELSDPNCDPLTLLIKAIPDSTLLGMITVDAVKRSFHSKMWLFLKDEHSHLVLFL